MVSRAVGWVRGFQLRLITELDPNMLVVMSSFTFRVQGFKLELGFEWKELKLVCPFQREFVGWSLGCE